MACSKALRRRPMAEEMRGVETSSSNQRLEKSSPQKWSRSERFGKAYAKSEIVSMPACWTRAVQALGEFAGTGPKDWQGSCCGPHA